MPIAPTPAENIENNQIATTAFVKTVAKNYLPLTGGTLTGTLSGNLIQGNSLRAFNGSRYNMIYTPSDTGNATMKIQGGN